MCYVWSPHTVRSAYVELPSIHGRVTESWRRGVTATARPCRSVAMRSSRRPTPAGRSSRSS
jgi:hypothetical protein